MANEKERKRRKMMMIMNINEKLTEDIVKVIFSKLAFYRLPTCRIVCKAWNHLVLDSKRKLTNAFLVCTSGFFPNPGLPKIHSIDLDTNNSIATLGFDRTRVKILSSCNGLLHVFTTTGGNGILNPMTNEFFGFPGTYSCIFIYGFGFTPKTKQYKVFGIGSKILEVWRFGISNQWKSVEGYHSYFLPFCSTCFDGVIYCIGMRNSISTTRKFVVYGLNVETEITETVTILDFIVGHSTKNYIQIKPFNGTIGIIFTMFEQANMQVNMQVWIRSANSWIKKFVIDIPSDGKHMKFLFAKVFEGEEWKYFAVNNNIFGINKSGKKIEIKTSFNIDKINIDEVHPIESIHFYSLPRFWPEVTETCFFFR